MPKLRLIEILEHILLLAAVTAVISSCSPTGSPVWELIGPEGRAAESAVMTVAAHPTDSGRLIVGARPEGALLTLDGGKTWQATSEEFISTLDQGFNAKGLLYSHSNLNEVYAGIERLGVWKSVDGGFGWIEKNTGIAPGNGRNAVSFAIALDHSNVIYVGTDGGLYKSTSGGDEWQRLTNGLPGGMTVLDSDIHSTVSDVLVSFDDSDKVYAAYYTVGIGETAGVYKSVDGGDSWIAANAGIETGPDELSLFRRESAFGLAIDPHDPDTLYVGTQSGIYKSQDAAETWVLQYDNWCMDVLVAPENPAIVYAILAPDSVIRSLDGGTSWSDFSTGLPRGVGERSLQQIEVTLPDGRITTITANSIQDENAVFAFRLQATPADPGRIYLATSEGVYRTVER